MTTLDQVRSALRLIDGPDAHPYLQGPLVSLSVQLHLAGAAGNRTRQQSQVLNDIVQATFDLSNILTLIARLHWTRNLAISGAIPDGAWYSFASVDIYTFHVEYRSIFDYCASLVRHLAVAPKSVPHHSYNDLLNWLAKPPQGSHPAHRSALGDPLAAIVAETTWFRQFRDVRDEMVHRGAHTVVFGPPADGILFQVFDSTLTRPLVDKPPYYVSPNVADFELYAAYWVSPLLLFLNNISDFAFERLVIPKNGPPAQYSHTGLGPLRRWLTRLEGRLATTAEAPPLPNNQSNCSGT